MSTETRGQRRRRETLDFIVAYQLEWGFSPAVADIAHGLNVSKTAIRGYLLDLEIDGRIIRSPGKQRSLVVVKGGS